MYKIVTILGARPQFIKASVVSNVFKDSGTINEIILHTGQHFDEKMSNIFFQEMMIPKPKYNLEIHSLSHGAMTGRMIEEIEKILLIEKPDAVLVYGDTNSTLAGAIAAKKLNFILIHIESGLRAFSYSLPEEMNRVLTDRISNLLFCPSKEAIINLTNEGFNNFECKFLNVGDVMYDACLKFSNNNSKILEKLDLKPSSYVLSTIHRNENTDNIENLKNIISALNEISKETRVILPIHPRTRNLIFLNNISIDFNIIDPIGYIDMMKLISNCTIVISDSGGIQKEAYFNKKNCLNLRNESEWKELIDNKNNINVGNKTESIINAYNNRFELNQNYESDFYGSGNSSQLIVSEILKFLSI
jgi:UDP-GlcNAc3NAcA epimerase